MVITEIIRKLYIEKVEITRLERFRPIEIKLPFNITRITGLLVTASRKEPFTVEGKRLGLVSFQANDGCDVFHVAEVIEDGIPLSSNNLLFIGEPQFERKPPWITGDVPKIKTVNIAGDNVLIKAWLKGEVYSGAYTMRIYVEYEEAEKLIAVLPDQPAKPTELDKILEAKEVYL